MPSVCVRQLLRQSAALTLAGTFLVTLDAASPGRERRLPGERPLGAALQVSAMGPDGNPAYDANAPAVAFNSTDNQFLVVWSGTDTPGAAIFGRRIAAATGSPIGAQFVVAPNAGTGPSVAYNSGGNEYLVMWTQAFASGTELFGQRLAADGTRIGEPVRISQMTTGAINNDPLMKVYGGTIVYNPLADEYLAVWSGRHDYILFNPLGAGERFSEYPSRPSVFAQRISTAGANIGDHVRITPFDVDLNAQQSVYWGTPVAVHNTSTSEYFVVWEPEPYANGPVSARRLSAAGAPLGTQALTVFGGCCCPASHDPHVAVNGSTNDYLVLFTACTNDTLDAQIHGQVVTAAGALSGARFTISDPVSATGHGFSGGARVAYSPVDQEFLVVWTRFDAPAAEDQFEVHGQRLTSAYAEIGPNDFRISHMGPDGDPAYGAWYPAVAADSASGKQLVVWTGDDNANGHVDDEFEIYGQLYIPNDPYVIGLAPLSANGGWMQQRDDVPALGGLGWLAVPWADYDATGGGTHPAMGDVDGDGRDEIVVGLDAAGQNWVVILDDRAHGHAVLRWVHLLWPSAGTAIYPAVGDIDADGRDEIVLGLGPGTGGWFYLLDDAANGFGQIGWRQVDWPTYAAGDGRTHPAIGDVDGDGSAEIVIGLGPGSAGWVEVFNGAAGGYSHRAWLHLPWDGYNASDGTTWPAAGDVDGDGADEIVLGLGPGSDGWIAVLDDDAHGFAPLRWLQIDWAAYNSASGETHPAVGNVDADPRAEIIAGLGTWSLEGGWYELFDDLIANTGSAGFAWRQIDWGGYNATGGGTYPAVSRRRGP